ncbi:hypothetical protein SCUCBS95973_003035 [Sporothrix curviconia]|uniref:FAD-binding domain-containing protein n=1 Tax=Sporothrix curviconia TaxID=1260050 RepID=A0ABP0BC30_9PEZI
MTWKVAIVGGGPGGLGAAIALSQLNAYGQTPLVDWTLYEKKPRISETGGGISIQRHTWRMLELLGVADRIDARDFFRPEDGRSVEHRNAVTGVLLAKRYHSDDTPPHQASCRMLRSKLQKALLSALDASRIITDKKLVNIENVATGTQLTFDDGEVSVFDLVIGADGIRSVARLFIAPGHKLTYNGQSAYRTILRKSDVAAINGIPAAPIFWQYVGSKYVYTCPLGGDDFELTARIRPDEEDAHARASQVSWGQPFDLNKLLPKYSDFAPQLRAILKLAADSGGTQEFAMFHGPRLDTVVRVHPETHGSGVLLLGDASHPLSGAFGAGAGFALEDSYTLARALAWAHKTNRPLADALWIYDTARSAHYANLYEELDRGAGIIKDVTSQKLPLHEEISERVRRLWDEGASGSGWIYTYHADEVVEEIIKKREAELAGGQNGKVPEKAEEASTEPTATAVGSPPAQEVPTMETELPIKREPVGVVHEVVAAAA